MNKILLGFVCMFLVLPSFADDGSGMMMGMVQAPDLFGGKSSEKTEIEKGCGINAIRMSGFQDRDDNEFLYENKAVYDKVPDTKNGTYKDLPGRVWECDNEYCPNRTVIQAPAGHYFKGIRQPSANWYKCRSDEWHPFACGETYISFDGTQAAADNEFLYQNKSAFETAKRASVAGQDGADIPGGKVWECDNRHCMGRALIKMPANHYFKGKLVDHAVEYRCYTGVEDRWEPVGTVEKGSTCGETYISFDGQGADDNEFLYSNGTAYQAAKQAKQMGHDGKNELGGTVYECDNGHCKNGVKIDMGPNHWFEGKEIKEKRSYLCKANFAGDDRWVLLTSMNDNGSGQETPVDKNCRDNRATDTGKACCDIPANAARYDAASDKCICSGNFDFVIENGRGVCKARAGGGDGGVGPAACPDGSSNAFITQESCLGRGAFECTRYAKSGGGCECGRCIENNTEPEKPYECDPAFLVQVDFWAQECKDETKYAKILALISRIKEYCSDDQRTEEGFLSLRRELEALNPEKCAMETYNMISHATTTIRGAVNTLSGLVADLEVSKWKNKDGKFNTARLASDSIAGVVLGTAGGLITSHVVKKHQVEDGFEDMQCIIGGQTVAGWGDEFTVGVQ